MKKNNIAIIGAGISGLALAHHLQQEVNITLFEKARGVGGRMSTRYTDRFQFDHGAQFFTARSKQFKDFLNPFINTSIVREWKPKVVTLEKGKKSFKRMWFEPHYVASSKMNSLCKALAQEQTVMLNKQIVNLSNKNNQWYLIDENDAKHGPFDWVICTAPAPQTEKLLPSEFTDIKIVSERKMTGCFSMMIGLKNSLPIKWGAAKVKASPIEWIAIDSMKPDRKNDCCSLLIQSSNSWAEAHIESELNIVSQILIEETQSLLDLNFDNISYQSLHRWKYANTVIDEHEDENPSAYFIDPDLKLATCGDWCMQGRVESAYLSAYELALNLSTTHLKTIF